MDASPLSSLLAAPAIPKRYPGDHFAFSILLIPTTAMGLTLPILLEDPLLKQKEFGRSLGLLYGANTMGAMIGALAGETYLVGACGLLGNNLHGGIVELRRSRPGLDVGARLSSGAPKSKVPQRFGLSVSLGRNAPWRLLAVSMAGGAVLLGLEVIWFRFLRLYVASTSLAYSVMLAVVLAGIALGGIISSFISARTETRRQLLPSLLLLAAVATLLSCHSFPCPPRHQTSRCPSHRS